MPARTCSLSERLWVDVTTLLTWQGKHSGVPRTIASLLRPWQEGTQLPLRLCRFDSGRQVFLGVTAAELDESIHRAAAPATLPPARSRSRRWSALVPKCVRPACHELRLAGFHLGGALRHLAAGLAATVRGQGRHSARGGKTGRSLPVSFAPGDILFSPGGSWDERDYCAAVNRLRQEAGLRFVPLLYDLIPNRFPHFFPPGFPALFRDWAVQLLGTADLVVTISANSRRDIEDFAAELSAAPPPVAVIRLGDVLDGDGIDTSPAQLRGTEGFALAVGTFEVRKNHILLYQVWRHLAQQYGPTMPPLVLAGRTGWLTGDLLSQIENDPTVRERILLLPGVSDAELRWLYRNARCLLYPSHYEGWGLPVAEALAHGKYCIVSGTSSLPEIGGDLVDYHDPLDLYGCARLAARALFDEAFRARREEQVRQCYRPTRWVDCARSLLAILRETPRLPHTQVATPRRTEEREALPC